MVQPCTLVSDSLQTPCWAPHGTFRTVRGRTKYPWYLTETLIFRFARINSGGYIHHHHMVFSENRLPPTPNALSLLSLLRLKEDEKNWVSPFFWQTHINFTITSPPSSREDGKNFGAHARHAGPPERGCGEKVLMMFKFMYNPRNYIFMGKIMITLW